MKRHLYIIWLVMLLAFGTAARAQQPTPTPTPSDTQTVAPENLQGVPAIAPNYRSTTAACPISAASASI
ncbi:MAG: hypothetical protein IPP63_10785 [Chloracidobacterium sp.]|nr:hypothetical protein [Chloracidobacterium sp.]